MFRQSQLNLDDADVFTDFAAMSRRLAPTRRILVVLHQACSNPGRIGRILVQQGYRLDLRCPALGDSLPRGMDAHDAAIIFGGPMSANDEADHVRREIDWVGVPLAAGKPFLGVCLGAQMLARHLGERVAPHPQGRVEVGYYPIRATPDGRKAWPLFPEAVYQWHVEGFDLPRGATLLAEGDDFPVQAFRYGSNAYAIQFHPEVTYSMMCRWTTRSPDRMAQPGACPRERHFRDWYAYDGAVSLWLDGFLRQWVRGAQAMAPMRTLAAALAGAGASSPDPLRA